MPRVKLKLKVYRQNKTGLANYQWWTFKDCATGQEYDYWTQSTRYFESGVVFEVTAGVKRDFKTGRLYLKNPRGFIESNIET